MSVTSLTHLSGIDRTLRVVAVTSVVLLAVWGLGDVLLLIFATVLLACILDLPAGVIERRTGLSRGASVVLIMVLLLVIGSALVWWRGPILVSTSVDTGNQLELQFQRLWDLLGQSPLGRIARSQLRIGYDSVRRGFAGYVPGVAGSVLGIGGSLLVVTASSLFIAASPRRYVEGSIRLLPIPWRSRARGVMREIGLTLQNWFAGQLVDMAVVATLTGIGLFALGVPLALTLALIAGLLNFVPFVGALFGAAPAMLVAFSQSTTTAIWVAVLFTAVQTIEGNIIAPVVQKKAVSLPPALTILSQTVLGAVFGAVGLLLATPLTAAALVFVRSAYIEGVLERSDHNDDL